MIWQIVAIALIFIVGCYISYISGKRRAIKDISAMIKPVLDKAQKELTKLSEDAKKGAQLSDANSGR